MTHDRHPADASPAATDLDAVLRDWRRRQDATVNAAALGARVAAAIRSDAALAPPPAGPRPRGGWVERTGWFAAGIAAAVAVAFGLRTGPRDGAENWPPSVRLAAAHLAEKATLVAGMEDTFGADLAWIAEHDRRVEVGLVPDALPGGGAVAVRIVVLSRRVGETGWATVWQSDVITRDEQLVDVPAGPRGTGRLRLWTHPLPDGAIAVDGELALSDAPLPLRASYGGVQRPGEPRRVIGDRADGVEWQVIQTVVPLAVAREDVG